MSRTFIAVLTPEDVCRELRSLQVRLGASGADVRWEPPHKLHLTMRFLGDVDDRLMSGVLSSVERSAATLRPFRVGLGELGCFPDRERPRVIWLGCSDDEGGLGLLKKSLDTELLAAGFASEDRDFRPHITIGRVRGRAAHLTSLVESLTFEPRHFVVSEVVTMKSTLRPGGSQYSQLQRVHLQL